MGDVLGIIPRAPGANAIEAAVEQAERPAIRMARIPVTISSTQRPAAVEVPADATADELAELCAWILTQVRVGLREQAEHPARGRIVLP